MWMANLNAVKCVILALHINRHDLFSSLVPERLLGSRYVSKQVKSIVAFNSILGK